MGGAANVQPAARAERRRPGLELRRRPGHGEQDARRPHRLGPHAEGRLPALQGPARLPSALPERVRLPGPLDRGRRRARARPQLEARDRGVRPRRVLTPLPREGRLVGRRDHARLRPPGPVDGLGQRLLHLLGHEHRVHLGLPQAHARAGLPVPRPPLDRVVPALRHVDLRARAGRELRGPHRPVPLRPPAADRPSGRGARRLDDHAVDAARQRRRRRASRRRSTAGARTASGSRCAAIPTSSSRIAAPAPSSSAGATRARSTTCPPRPASSTASSRGTTSRWTRAPGSSTSRRAAARRTSSSRASTISPCSRRSTRPGASTPTTAGCTGSAPPRRPTSSSPTSPSADA